MYQLSQKPDMPGDKVLITEDHIQKAQKLFDRLITINQEETTKEVTNKANNTIETEETTTKKTVVSICGPSGVGKSEIALVLGAMLTNSGHKAYVVSGDNYPHLIPKLNDARRFSIYQDAGTRALKGMNKREKLTFLQNEAIDSDPKILKDYPWLEAYQKEGKVALKNYLGTKEEQDFDYINEVLNDFKSNKDKVYLKHMGRTETELWYDELDVSDVEFLILEWTHGNSASLNFIDQRIFLFCTPEETLEHRRKRARDNKVDSSFTSLVLSIEQDLLLSQSSNANIILDKQGNFIK